MLGNGLGIQDEGGFEVQQAAGRACGVRPAVARLRRGEATSSRHESRCGRSTRHSTSKTISHIPSYPPHSLPCMPSHRSSLIGQGSAYHAFRTTVPDLDHGVPHPLTALHLERAARFGFESSSCRVLVARTYTLSRHLSELDSPPNMGVRFRRTLGGGCICGHPRTQASHAVAYRSKLPLYLHPSFCNGVNCASRRLPWADITLIPVCRRSGSAQPRYLAFRC